MRFALPPPSRSSWAGILLFAVALATAEPRATRAAGIPAEGTLSFVVLRGDREVGRHVLRFTRDGASLTVDIRVDAHVDVAFITVYRYTHRAREIWREDTLVALESQTDEDGDKKAVTAQAVGDHLQIVGGDGPLTMPLGTLPASYWNIGIVRQPILLDARSGIPLAIEAADRGDGTVETRRGKVRARHFHLLGYEVRKGRRAKDPSYDMDLWYDSGDRLIGMTFRYRGETIRYELE